MKRGTEAGRVLRLAIALVAVLAPAIVALPPDVRAIRQDDAGSAERIVGTVEPGALAFEFVGRVERRASSVSVYGFLSHLAGVDPEALFTDPANPSPETARFTYFGSADPTQAFRFGDVAVAVAVGELGIYYNPPGGASFEAAESFFSGTRVAQGAGRFHDVLLGDPDDVRPVDAFAEVVLIEVTPFALEDGSEIQFGEPNDRLHLRAAGLEDPPAEGASVTRTTLAGRAVAVSLPGREAAPTPTPPPDESPTPEDGENGEPTEEPDEEETPTAAGIDCDEAETWLVGSLGRVGRTRALVTEALRVLEDDEADPFEELDPDALREAADELNELADAQQDAEAPDGLEDAGRQLVSSFQSFARGLNLLATAVANENENALQQARTLLEDADETLAEASGVLAGLAADCGISPR